ncbi:MAG: WXG100 family type VII secretion target [Bacilli bacterium]|nr:WXG100 family type VII secretion target [Bacilli bacterium]
MPSHQLATDYHELERFANELERFCDSLEYDTKKLQNETDYVTESAWKGQQASEFQAVIAQNGELIQKDVRELRELVDKIRESAKLLRDARERKIS